MQIPFFSKRFKSKPRIVNRRRPTLRPELEVLEDRLVPATRTWDGGALSNNWSNSKNWVGDVAPVAGDTLVFPAGDFDKTADNDFADGTRFNALTLSGSGYTLKGNAIKLNAAGITASHSNVIKLNVQLDNANPTFNVTSGGILTVEGAITGLGNLAKDGLGALTFDANNSYSGATTIKKGILIVSRNSTLGSTDAGTTVKAGATLRLEANAGFVVRNVDEPLTFEGGSQWEMSGFLEVRGNVTLLGGEVAVHPDFDGDSADQLLSCQISGPGGWNLKRGSLSMVGDASNTYQGATTIGRGSINLGRSALAIPGNLIIGTTATAAEPARVFLTENHQISNSATVTVLRHGELDLEGKDEEIGSLALSSGKVTMLHLGVFFIPTNGTLTLNGDLSATSVDAATPATISGKLNLGPATRIFNVSDGPAFDDLVVDAEIVGGGGIAKNGAGIAKFTANNDYAGLTTINGGTLRVHGNQPNSGVIVNSGARLTGNGEVGALTVRTGGTVRPGPLNGPGILRAHGDALFEAGSTLQVFVDGPIAGTGHDQLTLADGLSVFVTFDSFEANLDVIVGPNSRPGDRFRIVDTYLSNSIFFHGQFAGLNDEAVFTTPSGVRLSINYRDLTERVAIIHENSATMAPELAVAPGAIVEGQVVTVTGRLHDPDLSDELTLRVDWKDGSPVETFHPGRVPFALKHRYKDDGIHHPNFVWFDEHGAGNSRALEVRVANVAPRLVPAIAPIVFFGGYVVLLGWITDPGADSLTGTVNFGDGTSPQSLEVRGGRFVIVHHYLEPGRHTFRVTIDDGDGGMAASDFTLTTTRQANVSALAGLVFGRLKDAWYNA